MNRRQAAYLCQQLGHALSGHRGAARDAAQQALVIPETEMYPEDYYDETWPRMMDAALNALVLGSATEPGPPWSFRQAEARYLTLLRAFDDCDEEELSPVSTRQLSELARALGCEVPSFDEATFVCGFRAGPLPLHLTDQHAGALDIALHAPCAAPAKVTMAPFVVEQLTLRHGVAHGRLRLQLSGVGPCASLEAVLAALRVRVSHPGSGPCDTQFTTICRAPASA